MIPNDLTRSRASVYSVNPLMPLRIRAIFAYFRSPPTHETYAASLFGPHHHRLAGRSFVRLVLSRPGRYRFDRAGRTALRGDCAGDADDRGLHHAASSRHAMV